MTIAYLNGEFLPLQEAKVSVLDRGFLFGDGVYEVIPVYAGQLFRLEQHLVRLVNSLAAISLPFTDDLTSIIKAIIMRNGSGNQSVYLQITRGFAPMREHSFPLEIKPTVLIYSVPLLIPSLDELSQGLTAITLNDIRWQRCDVKAITLLANTLMRQQAKDAGADDAILLNAGYAIEGTASNLFMVKNNTIITPPLSNKILAGITREVVLELAIQEGIAYLEQDILETDLYQADEIWLTSSTKEIIPVLKINQNPVGNGKAGPVWQQMIQAYQNFKQSLINP
jgi:D-alanine transaminase